jgi:hypothetical protein
MSMAERIRLESFSTITRQAQRKVSVSIESGYVSIKTPGAQDYDIPLVDIKTNKQLVEWIHHLTEKTWVTGEIIHDVIDAAVIANKLPFYGENK